jgi:hypothetical protein
MPRSALDGNTRLRRDNSRTRLLQSRRLRGMERAAMTKSARITELTRMAWLAHGGSLCVGSDNPEQSARPRGIIGAR